MSNDFVEPVNCDRVVYNATLLGPHATPEIYPLRSVPDIDPKIQIARHGWILGWIAVWRGRYRMRRHLSRLLELDADYLLDDVGIERKVALREVCKPFWLSPEPLENADLDGS